MTDFITLQLVSDSYDSHIMAIIIAINATSRSVSVSWTEIECIESNGPITNYTVQWNSKKWEVL